MKTFILTLSIVLLLSFAGCKAPVVNHSVIIDDIVEHPTFSSNVEQIKWSPEPPLNLGIGFIYPEDKGKPPEERLPLRTFFVEANQPLQIYMLLDTVSPRKVLVTAIVDYKQQPFTLDGKSGLLHEFMVNPGGDYEIPIEISLPTTGWHDLMLIAFYDHENNTVDVQDRMDIDEKFIGVRGVVLVGDKNAPPPKPSFVASNSTMPDDVSLFGAFYATKGKQHPTDRQFYVEKGKAGMPFDFNIWFTNLQGLKDKNYAFMLFQDYHQLPIDPANQEPATLFATVMGERGEMTIPSSIPLPTNKTLTQLQLAYVVDPYQSVDDPAFPYTMVLGGFRAVVEITP